MPGTFQALAGSHNSDVVPHETAQFVPVMGDDDFFVRVRDAALIPLWQGGRGRFRLPEDVACSGLAEHQAFQQ